MAVERTLSIIKPDAVAKNVIGEILARFEKAGLKIVAARMAWLSRGRSRGILRRAQGAPLLPGPGRVHDFRPGDDPGARRRGRHREEPRADGRDRSQEGRRRHDPRRLRAIDRRQRRARLGRPGDRRARKSRISSRRSPSTAARTKKSHGSRTPVAMTNLLDLDPPALADFFAERGEKPFRARQVIALGASAVRRRRRRDDRHRRSPCASAGGGRVGARADGDPRHHGLRRHAQVAARRRQRQRRGSGVHPGGRRGTLCISSQAGCALDCAFCSTGKQGFNRNLSTGEIIGQLWHANRTLLAEARQRVAPALDRAGPPADHQRGDDGHGRAAGQLRQRGAGACA